MVTQPAEVRLVTESRVLPGGDIRQSIIADAQLGGGEGMLDHHVNDTTPHPAYDDLPSLTSLFQNRLV